MAVRLAGDQVRTVRDLARAPSWRRASPKVRLALLEAAGVESNYRHLDYGDRDSVGVLQQRPSQGWGPASESATQDAEQFLQRAIPLSRKYGTAGQLAQAVQRSAFPERYDARRGEARQIARQVFGGLRDGGSGGGGSTSSSAPAREAGPAQERGDTGALVDLLRQGMERSPIPVSAPPSPAFSAGAVMPAAYQGAVPAAPPAPRASLDEAISLAATLRGPAPAAPERPSEAAGGAESGSAGSRRSGGPVELYEMFYDPGINVDNGRRVDPIGGHGGHLHVAAPRDDILRIARRAQRMGLRVGELEPFDRVDPVHTRGSFHYRKRAADISGDSRKLAQLNRELARESGVR